MLITLGSDVPCVAYISSLVIDDFFERIGLLALVKALEHQVVFNVPHDMILGKEEPNGVTGGAFKMILVWISLALSFGKSYIAVPAT